MLQLMLSLAPLYCVLSKMLISHCRKDRKRSGPDIMLYQLHLEIRRVLKPGGLYIFVEHVAAADGTVLRFVQGLLDPLQQTLADGCHLTRKTEEDISEAGFSNVDSHRVVLSAASLINPHIIGIAHN